jgi:tripartite-type tricarboxylate transporter receptor subunit TctC
MPFVLVVNPELPARSVADLIEAARQRPGQLNYGSAGNGGGVHLTMELFKHAAGIDLVHVPYKGGAPLLADLIAGRVQAATVPVSTAMPLVRDGRLRALAVTSAERVGALPDLPSIAETLPGFDSSTWYGVLAPAGTPAAIVARLNTALAPILGEDEIVARVTSFGGAPAIGPPAAFGALIHAELARWAALAKQANVHLD